MCCFNGVLVFWVWSFGFFMVVYVGEWVVEGCVFGWYVDFVCVVLWVRLWFVFV